MNIKKRIERLENEQANNSEMKPGFWNFEKVSDEDLIELRNLTIRDPAKAYLLQEKLVSKGMLKYEYHQ